MLDAALRPLKDRLLAPLVRAAGGRFTPDVVSLVAFAFGLASAALAADRRYAAALACWLLNRVLDGLDGALARARSRTTERGGYLDLLLDFVVYALVPVGLVAGRPSYAAAFAALWLLASFYVNAASWMYLSAILERRAEGAAARGEPTVVTIPAGLIAGTETIVFYVLFFLFPDHLVALFAAMALLVGVTAMQRLIWGVRHLAGGR